MSAEQVYVFVSTVSYQEMQSLRDRLVREATSSMKAENCSCRQPICVIGIAVLKHTHHNAHRGSQKPL